MTDKRKGEEKMTKEVTKDELVRYVEEMKIKKVSIGGYDKVEVYAHIQELFRMYGEYMNQEISKQKGIIEKQKGDIEQLENGAKNAREELAARMGKDRMHEQEVQELHAKIADLEHHQKKEVQLLEELKEKDADVSRREEESEVQKRIMEELQTKNEELQAKNEELQTKSEELQTEIEEKTTVMEAQRTEIERLEMSEMESQESEELKKELKKQTEEISLLQEELLTHINEKEMLKREVEEQQELFVETGKLYQSLKEKTEKEAEKEMKEKGNQQEIENLQRQMEEKEQIITDQEQELQSMRKRLEEEIRQAKEEKEREVSTVTSGNDYQGKIGEILGEARKEGQNIIDNARIEAEKEMIKLLNLRVRFKQEKETYQDWCKRIETEKEMLKEFLRKLSVQYGDAIKAFDTVNEKAASFDIKKMYKVIDSNQGGIEENTYEKKEFEVVYESQEGEL